jgi:hypothetical protein
VAISACEFTTALATAEVLGMHSLTLQCDELALDVPFAKGTNTSISVLGGGLSSMTGNTVRFSLPFFVLLPS